MFKLIFQCKWKKNASSVLAASAFSLLAPPISISFVFFLLSLSICHSLSLSHDKKIHFNLLSTKLIICRTFLSFVAKHAHGIQIKKSSIRESEDLLHATTWMKVEDIMLSEIS